MGLDGVVICSVFLSTNDDTAGLPPIVAVVVGRNPLPRTLTIVAPLAGTSDGLTEPIAKGAVARVNTVNPWESLRNTRSPLASTAITFVQTFI